MTETHEASTFIFFEVWEPGANHPLAITSMVDEARSIAEPDDEIRRVEWARIREVS